MPELNLDKIVSSLNLRIDSLETKDDIEELKKDFLGKNSLISEERKKLSSMSNEDKKKYGQKLTELNNLLVETIEKLKLHLLTNCINKKKNLNLAISL